MNKHFTHLHLHTDFSLLDGAITIDKLLARSKEHAFSACAISDHGNIFGAVKFFQQAKKSGLKPVLGMEAYFTHDVRIKKADDKYYHLLLLVQNSVGYKNLCKLISYSYNQGFYFKPRIDYQMLEQHSEGLLVTTACLGGHVPSLLMQEQYEEADKRIDWFLKTFGEERFYLEVQPADQPEQKILNEKIFDLSARRGIQCVAAADCHYVSQDDREAHEIMLSIQTHHKLTDPDRFTFGDCRAYMRSTQEMLDCFPGHEEAIWNAGVIADSCNFSFETGKLFFPQFEIPKEHTQESFFTELCKTGLETLFIKGRIPQESRTQYDERLTLEIELIIKMGFVGYFLVVSDFIQWAKNHQIPVGPGRGSCAGSLVSWALQITDIDPIKYNLLFERFLNPERISMPDIDIDFCIEGRDKVINYVRDKYGHDKVCQIITFGTMMAKGVIKDVARALGFPFEDSNAITDLIPDQLKITLKEAVEQEPKLKELIAHNEAVAKLFDIAYRLEGITRHASKHAAGIVISPQPINDVLPVYIPPKTNELVTQYAMTELEALGFLKMDFLGLKNLTLIKRALDLIEQNSGKKINIIEIPIDDLKTFELLSRGDTSGVFQLESDGIKDVLRRLQPAVFEDIIAVNALYRPGPLGSGMVDDFIERKHGRQKISYLFPELAPVLQETYGVIVYQEQVMKIASTIGGYSLGEADILRRAMGKKKADEMAKQGAIFVERAITKNFDGKKARELFDLMAYFAGYGFNKSHSAAYALVAYQTAYLKAHFPAEFMACLISLESSNAEQMALYIQEAKEMSITVMAPDINSSHILFTVSQDKILFGLQGIKNVGLAALEDILVQRKKNLFVDLLDFCTRIDLRTANKRVIESLICAGAFDALPGSRSQKYDELHTIIELALEKKQAAKTGQISLFGSPKPQEESAPEHYSYQPKAEWPDSVKLEKEKEVLGVYMSSQPLDRYAQQLGWLRATQFHDFKNYIDGASLVCCGTLTTSKVITTKKGDKMAFISLEDGSGKGEIIVFPKLYNQIEPWLSSYQVFLFKGNLDTSSTAPKLKAQSCIPMDLLCEQWACERLIITMPQHIQEDILANVKNALTAGSTPLELRFNEQGKQLALKTREKIRITQELLSFLQKHDMGIEIKV